MRILHVYKAYPPVIGGMENHVRTLAEAQVRAGHEVTVLVAGRGRSSEREVRQGVSVIRAARLAELSSAPISLSLVLELGRLAPDVTHLHSPYPIGEAAWLAFGRRPMVLTYQSDIVRQRFLGRLWAPGLRRVLAHADRVLATSPAYARSSPFLRRVADHVEIVPLGIETGRFAAIERRPEALEVGREGRVLFVGRLRYYKGLDVLLDAMARLTGARLAIVGDGPMGPELGARARRLGLEDRIEWAGDVSEAGLLTELARADVFVLPSTARSEAYGLAMVEAMAAGLPVVSTELGTGTSWVNQDGITGLVVPAGQPEPLAAAVRRLLEDAELRRRMGEAARSRAVGALDARVMIDRVEAIYREVRP